MGKKRSMRQKFRFTLIASVSFCHHDHFEWGIFASSEIRNVISKEQKQISVSVLSKSSQPLPLFVTRALRNNNRMAKKYEGKLVIWWDSVVVCAFSSVMLNTVIADYFCSFRNYILTWSCILQQESKKVSRERLGQTRDGKRSEGKE